MSVNQINTQGEKKAKVLECGAQLWFGAGQVHAKVATCKQWQGSLDKQWELTSGGKQCLVNVEFFLR